MSQAKNNYYISGVLMILQPVTSRPYTNKQGVLIENKERIIVVRHKISKYGKWKINDITIHCSRDAVDQLSLMQPGLEVIVDFSIEVISWKDKVSGENKRFQKLSCTKIMSPTDKYKSEKWWADENRQPSRKQKIAEDDNIPRLSDQEEKRKRPDNKEYDIKTHNKGGDYSEGDSVIIKEPEYKPVEKEEPQSDLPF
jgi:hypothetical protein